MAGYSFQAPDAGPAILGASDKAVTEPFGTPEASAIAAKIARGVARLFATLGQPCLFELPLANGRRADVVALAANGEFSIVEIKSCRADFLNDGKWRDYLEFCDRFYFAVGEDFPLEILPNEAGLIVADGFGGAILRDGPQTPLVAARRKALTLRFAQTAAVRLMRALDPDAP